MWCHDAEPYFHGLKTPTNGPYRTGDKITFTCDTDYELKGDAVLECTSSGEWNISRPTCQSDPQSIVV